MSTQPGSHYSLSNRSKLHSEKHRKNSNYYHHPNSSKSDWNHSTIEKDILDSNGYADSQNYTFDNPSDIEFQIASDEQSESNYSTSLYDDLISPDETGDTDECYRDLNANSKQRERIIKNESYSNFSSSKRAPIYNADNYDDVSLRMNSPREDYVERGDKSKIPYESAYDSEATSAMQKLQKLRELQRRRDYTEKYYSYEIRKLIGDQYPEVRSSINTNPFLNRQQKKYYSQSYIGDGLKPKVVDNLEACGTMTTVTRLNCGCVEQTTRPIFTTISCQQIQRRNCSQDQKVHVRLSAPNARLVVGGNHYQPVPPNSRQRLKSKSLAEQQRPSSPVLIPTSTKQTLAESRVVT